MPPNGFIGKRLHQPPLLRNPTAISRLPPWRSEFFKVPSIELCCGVLWERGDSNPLSRKATDLQSVPALQLWRSPRYRSHFTILKIIAFQKSLFAVRLPYFFLFQSIGILSIIYNRYLAVHEGIEPSPRDRQSRILTTRPMDQLSVT